MPVQDAVGRGREALARGAWEEARAAFTAALGAGGLAAWEGLAWAAWWLDDGAAAIEAREHAYRLSREHGDALGAARSALWLGNDHWEFRGAEAVASGWFERARRILGDLEPAPEHGWLAIMDAYVALGAGDPSGARELGAQARELGRRFGLVSLEMLALATEGVALVARGDVGPGMRCLDEAAAAALGGEYEDLVCVGWTCCYLIAACERVRDYERAAQWCREVEAYASRVGIRFVKGVCRAHYGAVLTWHGDFAEAETAFERATDDLAARPFWAADVVVRLAELRRRQGRLDEAQALFARVEGDALAVLGLGEVALDRGDPEAAAEHAERLLSRFPPDNRTLRPGALELLARARAARGDAAGAQACAGELRAVAGAVGTAPLVAAAAFAEGVAAAAAGELEAARRGFEDAAERFTAGGAPFEAGRARLELARVLEALGRPEAARRQSSAAARLRPPAGAVLTARELQVLGLVSRGLRDRDIGAELTISEHTVHRHVANIYVKLRCSTRAAAVAEAHRLQLM